MWNEWSRWWSGRGAPGEGPPEESVLPTSNSENDRGPRDESNAVESESDQSTFQGATHTEAENADNAIRETTPPVEHADEPAGPTNLGDEIALGAAGILPVLTCDDSSADEPAGFPADEFDSPSADLDPVAELLRQGLGLPTGKSRARRGRRLVRPEEVKPAAYNPQQRLMILDCWQRSGLPAEDFAPLVGVSKHTLYAWKQRFDRQGPAGLLEQPRGASEGSRLPELTQRTILLLKQAHPDWGCERISHMLLRGPALPASPASRRPRPARGGLPAAGDAHPAASRTRSATSSGPGPTSSGRPTCSPSCSSGRTGGSTWSPSSTITAGFSSASVSTPASPRPWCSRFSARASRPTERPRKCSPTTALSTSPGGARVRFTRSSSSAASARSWPAPRHPQTLGKIERFWGTLWRECLETAVFLDLADARADRPFHRLVQLPARSQRDRRTGAGRPLFRRGSRGFTRPQGAGGRQRPGAGSQRPAQAAVLPDRPAGRRGGGTNASSENGRSRFVVTRTAAAGQPRRRLRLLVSHRAPCGIGIEVGRRTGWRRAHGEGRRKSPRSSVKPRSPAFWSCMVPASVLRASRPSTPMLLEPSWLGCERNIVPSGTKSTPRNSAGWSGSARVVCGRWTSPIRPT